MSDAPNAPVRGVVVGHGGMAIVFLAVGPKSNSVYAAWGAAREAVEKHGSLEVPLHIRNAPTALMKDLGFGKGYRYDHDEGGHAAGQQYLPDKLTGEQFWNTGSFVLTSS